MRRRSLLAGLALAAAAPGAWAQARPVIGYLSGRSPEVDTLLIAAFRNGLAEAGYQEGRDVAFDYVSAGGQPERLPALARALVERRVAVIFASSSNSALAAKAATATIPIVFTGASDPVRLGLAASLGHPGGNLTGVTMFAHAFAAKRLELLHELLPQVRIIGVLVNPANPSAATSVQDLQAAAATLGLEAVLAEARTEQALDAAFTLLSGRKVAALNIVDDPLFNLQRRAIAELSLRHGIPAISTLRELAEAGALASYGTSFAEVHRDCGRYVGRVLKGERPGDLPIMLPTRLTLVINSRTAAALGLTVPPMLLARADEVIE